MLIEVKAKVAWVIDGKVKKKQETYILDKEVFAEAEYAVMSILEGYKNEGTVNSYEIQALRISTLKEIVTQYQGEYTFIASLRDTFLQDDGTEKILRYKILLWANDITDAMHHIRDYATQGYNMLIDGFKEVNYTYLHNIHHEESTPTED